ncbi:ShlB/FhaC/HecB family hemolysin secretion/activation protein [Parahaliea maris]|uniref:ShlB/FhaC/HecB family hemolysin secretion/activation protein n=1 Tax=Parahaliea maris TaxID=2716870 RepID=A0A5C9A7F2_9GAMM|nr:ShlB/FhaC/HecB family hemolysin secretion/activation protein [Parahaliea maris]TXS96606.1 ShlB/FhaC/HecB family hemolysin secretion/activation protein [Parahaliea maris]
MIYTRVGGLREGQSSTAALLAALCSTIMLFSLPAAAQRIPGTVLPGQLQKQFEGRKKPQADTPSGSTRREMPLPVVPEGMEDISIEVNDIHLTGVTAYAMDDLRPLFTDRLGGPMSLADLYLIAEAITRRYRSDGYVLSQVLVPEQDVAGGVVQLQVVEGYIDQVVIRGDAPKNSEVIAGYLEQLKQERPVHIASIERYMLLVNDLDGIYAQSTLVPGEGFGSASLVVDVIRTAFDGLAGVDNRGSEYLGPTRGRLEFNANTLFDTHVSGGIFISSTGNDELNFVSARLESPLGDNGLRLLASGYVVRSEPDQGVQLRGLETDSESAVMGLSYPLWRSRAQNLTFNGQFSYYDGEVQIQGLTLSEDRVRALRLGLTWDLYDSLGGVNIVDATVSHGLDVLNATDPDSDFVSRPQAELDFTKLNLYAARLQSLSPALSLLVALDGQVAFDNVLNSEGYGFGGELFGRGYDPSELYGDSGAGLKLELRYLHQGGGLVRKAEPYVFYDIGYVRNKTEVVNSERSESAAAAGGGLRIDLGSSVTGYIEIAKPLTRDVFAEGNRDARVFGAVSFSF